MISRIGHSSYVIDFLDIDFSSDAISAILAPEVNLILSDLDFSNLAGWEVVFKALYTYTESLTLLKKTRSHPNEKYKEIVVAIPIPLKNDVKWGVESTQYISDQPTSGNPKYSVFIEINPADYP